MKRIIVFFTAALILAFTSSALGVDKKEKKVSHKAEVRADSVAQKRNTSTSDSQKKYDDFIDLDKNGKDDRLANRKSKSPNAVPVKLTQGKTPGKKPVSAVPKNDAKKIDSSTKKPN